MSYLSHYLAQVTGPCVGEALYEDSEVITVDDEVFALVTLGGPGGSGAIAEATSTGNLTVAGGGNAGGVVIKLIRMKPNVNYTYAAKNGGAAKQGAGGSRLDGNDGQDAATFISSDGIHSLSAAAGKGGKATYEAIAGTPVTQTHTPYAAVSGTGGHYHYAGGTGGSVNYLANSSTEKPQFGIGGGAVNIWGWDDPAFIGGGSEIRTGTVQSPKHGTGGGGVGGHGGDFNTTSTNYQASGGGGTGGPCATRTGGGSNSGSGPARNDALRGIGYYLEPDGYGGLPQYNATPSPIDGGAGAGGGGSTYSLMTRAGHGGIFGGGGGVGSASSGDYAGSGGLGAGGGGLCDDGILTDQYSGAGGDSFLIVRLFAIPGRIS